jgi:hypothetical protein
MPADENTRLRIRQFLIELMDEEAADAMMETMAPIPWTQLATKDDIARLDRRFDGLEGRIDAFTVRADQTSSDLQELTRTVATQGTSLGARMDSVGSRVDALGVHMSDLGRAVTVAAATMAVMLAVFIAGTIASLIASGAFG